MKFRTLSKQFVGTVISLAILLLTAACNSAHERPRPSLTIVVSGWDWTSYFDAATGKQIQHRDPSPRWKVTVRGNKTCWLEGLSADTTTDLDGPAMERLACKEPGSSFVWSAPKGKIYDFAVNSSEAYVLIRLQNQNQLFRVTQQGRADLILADERVRHIISVGQTIVGSSSLGQQPEILLLRSNHFVALIRGSDPYEVREAEFAYLKDGRCISIYNLENAKERTVGCGYRPVGSAVGTFLPVLVKESHWLRETRKASLLDIASGQLSDIADVGFEGPIYVSLLPIGATAGG